MELTCSSKVSSKSRWHKAQTGLIFVFKSGLFRLSVSSSGFLPACVCVHVFIFSFKMMMMRQEKLGKSLAFFLAFSQLVWP